jgi:uncharacterized protein (AIM24 family)
MSLVKIQGNASGTGIFTVAAPNSNTDRTLTLPDATGTVQVSGNPISGTTGSFSGDLSFNSGYGSAAVAYGCRAWVNFNGTGTVAIRASGNVSSITDNATGDYTVNFTTAMPDANYSVVIAASRSSDVFTTNIATNNATGGDVAPTTSAIRVVSNGGPGRGPYDSAYFCVTIFR